MERKVELIRTSNGSHYSPTQLYDSIQLNSYLTEGTRKYLSFVWMHKICTEASNTEVLKYYTDFKNTYAQDTTLINFFVKRYNLSDTLSDDINLIDEQGRKITWSEVLKKNKGKTLYVDFWASWCIPCRSLMPDSKKLHKKYADKKVKFMYFSIDKDEKAWKTAVTKDKLNENSYLIVNTEKPAFAEEINLGPIPRYLVFDKNGKLVEKDAPRPNQVKIETIFDKYLKE